MNNYTEIPLTNNTSGTKNRFEIHVNGHTAFMEYLISNQQIIYLTHTEVPRQLEGQGVGSALASKVLAHLRREALRMAPLCPFLAAYLKRHPEEAEGLLAPGYSIR